MALSKAVLGALIKSKMATVSPSSYDLTTEAGTEAYRTAILEAFADAIISHITTAGVVTVTSVTGVTAGAEVSGPGTGTIS